MLKRILGNFYGRLITLMGILLLTALFPMPVVQSSASTRIWLPGYYCVLVPDKAGQEIREAPACSRVRASEFKSFQENAVFVPVDSILVLIPGSLYTLPANIDADVYAMNSIAKRVFQAVLLLILVGFSFVEMVQKNLE